MKTQEDQSVKRIGGVDREVGSKASNEQSRSRDGVQEERYGRRVEELEGLLERERAEGRGVQDEVDILKSTVYSLTSLLKEEKEKGSGMREKLAVEIRENDGLLKELAEARAEIRRLSGLLNERARRGQAETGRNKNSLNQANNRVVKSSKGPSNAPVQSDPVYHTSK